MLVGIRILTTVMLLALGFILPWWLFLLAIVIACCIFRWYLEGIVIAILFDAFESSHTIAFHGFHSIFTLSAILAVVISFFIKARLRNR